MNRFNAITENQKTEELKKVLNSAFFKLKTRQRDLLQYLVNQALAGKEIGEAFIAENFYKIENFFSDENATVRQGVSELRKNLENYYSGEGKSDAVRILFPRGYTPEFVPAPLPRSPAGKRWPIVAACIAGIALLAGAPWLVYNRPCASSISITDPRPEQSVSNRYVVQVARKSEQSFCRCADYVVIEPVNLDQIYVAGRLAYGAQPSLTATFGDPETPPGTHFSVFVLTTKRDLTTGLLDQPLPADATQSAPVTVTLGNSTQP